MKILLCRNTSPHKLDHLLRGLAIPDACPRHDKISNRDISFGRRFGARLAWASKRTVTGNDQEFIIFGNVVDRDVRICGDNLLFRRETGALLELEITNGARQGQVAIDAAKVDETTGRANPCLLACSSIIRSIAQDQTDADAMTGDEPSFCGL